jgi:pyrroloquinoline quinone biosynthesis protein B
LGDTIGLWVQDVCSERRLFYAPGLGRVEKQVIHLMAQANVLLVDGTFWSEDEMLLCGTGTKLASEMGHLPQSGPDGMIELLRPMAKPRKVLIHINNTNPILDDDGRERELLRKENIEVAWDGMNLVL